jgi:hypothetical protein
LPHLFLLDRHLGEANGRDAQEEAAGVLAVAILDRIARTHRETGAPRERRERNKRPCDLLPRRPEHAHDNDFIDF